MNSRRLLVTQSNKQAILVIRNCVNDGTSAVQANVYDTRIPVFFHHVKDIHGLLLSNNFGI